MARKVFGRKEWNEIWTGFFRLVLLFLKAKSFSPSSSNFPGIKGEQERGGGDGSEGWKNSSPFILFHELSGVSGIFWIFSGRFCKFFFSNLKLNALWSWNYSDLQAEKLANLFFC